MEWRPDHKGLENFLRSLEVKTLNKGTKLYRGSFEGKENENWIIPSIRGVKYFTHERDYALKYTARGKSHPSYIDTPLSKKGILFCIELNRTCSVLEFPDVANTYRKFVQDPNPWRTSFDLFAFERNHLMEIIRNARGNEITGYITPNKIETIIDLDNVDFTVCFAEAVS